MQQLVVRVSSCLPYRKRSSDSNLLQFSSKHGKERDKVGNMLRRLMKSNVRFIIATKTKDHENVGPYARMGSPLGVADASVDL